jgi:hypothetical protein
MNEYNYVRSETLQIPSLEFFAIVAAAIFFLFFFDKKLIDIYIISLPFTDKVYRVLSLQPIDFISILVIVCNLKHLSTSLGYLYWIMPILLSGSLWGLIQHNDFFGFQYSFRILIIFGAINVIAKFFQDKESRNKYVILYKKVVWFSLIIAFLQVTLWYLNFPISGIFYSFGIPRMKGLGHEPSTFCFWLSLSIPFGIEKVSSGLKQTKYDVPYIVALLITMLITGSLTGLITTLAFFVFFMIYEAKHNLRGLVNFLFPLLLTITLLVATNTSAVSDYFGEYSSKKIGSYISEISGSSTAVEYNGRGGDRKLIQYFYDSPLFGIGAFRSSRLQDMDVGEEEYIPAANFYFTTPAEFGVCGSLALVWIFTSWIHALRRMWQVDNAVYGLTLLSWLISLVGMRVFGFHQPWFIMCVYSSFYHNQSLFKTFGMNVIQNKEES